MQSMVGLGTESHSLSPRKGVLPGVSAVRGEVVHQPTQLLQEETEAGEVLSCFDSFCPPPTPSLYNILLHVRWWFNKLLGNCLTKTRDENLLQAFMGGEEAASLCSVAK